MADLPAYSVAVIIPSGHSPDGDPVAVLHPDAAGVVAVEIAVVGLGAIERDVLDRDAGDVLTAEQREQAFHLWFTHQPDVLAQSGIELEAIPVAGHQRSLDDLEAAGGRVLHAQTDAVA